MEHNENFMPSGIKLNCQKPPAVFMGFDVYYSTSLFNKQGTGLANEEMSGNM